jgi:predicted outer membrane repeat protein
MASDDGGGATIISGGTLVADYATFASNSAADDGGAIANYGAITISHSQFQTNSANDGGAIHTEVAGSNALNSSCISGNTALVDTGGVRSTVAGFNATGNWWGAADGPSGAGPGTGDAVNANVDYSNFLTTGCPAGAGAATQSAGVIAALETQALPGDTLTLSTDQTPVTLPYTPSLADETVWRASGAWDLAAVTGRSELSWAVDALPRHQTSLLELAVPLDLGRRSSPAQLQFNQRIWLAGTDTFSVEVLPQGGTEWVGVDSQSASDTNWQSRRVDLAPFRGQTVRLRFRLVTGDEQDVTSVGVWLDGISLTSQR